MSSFHVGPFVTTIAISWVFVVILNKVFPQNKSRAFFMYSMSLMLVGNTMMYFLSGISSVLLLAGFNFMIQFGYIMTCINQKVTSPLSEEETLQRMAQATPTTIQADISDFEFNQDDYNFSLFLSKAPTADLMLLGREYSSNVANHKPQLS